MTQCYLRALGPAVDLHQHGPHPLRWWGTPMREIRGRDGVGLPRTGA
jgi:hypothetical protein